MPWIFLPLTPTTRSGTPVSVAGDGSATGGTKPWTPGLRCVCVCVCHNICTSTFTYSIVNKMFVLLQDTSIFNFFASLTQLKVSDHQTSFNIG